MERGDIIYKFPWAINVLPFINAKCISYRFRIDPVPGIHNHKGYHINRPFRVTQEKCWSFAYPEFTRCKRNKRNLPDPWDYFQVAALKNRRSWKRTKKRKQWM